MIFPTVNSSLLCLLPSVDQGHCKDKCHRYLEWRTGWHIQDGTNLKIGNQWKTIAFLQTSWNLVNNIFVWHGNIDQVSWRLKNKTENPVSASRRQEHWQNWHYDQQSQSYKKKILLNCTMPFWVAKLFMKSLYLSKFWILIFYDQQFKIYRNKVWQHFELCHALLICKITPKCCYALFPLKRITFLREFSFKKK